MGAEPPVPERPAPLPEVKLWAAVHAQPRAEKVVAAYLETKEIPHYLPMTLNRRVYGARVRYSWIPLFPGYLFYDTESADKRLVFASRRVVKILVPNVPEELREELENLAYAIAKKPDLTRTRITEPGTPVEVVKGPYAGTNGELVRRRGATKLVIRVHFIGYGAEMDIDEAWVRPVDPS